MDAIIDVRVIIFPDGSTHYFKKVLDAKNDENSEYVGRCLSEWGQDNPEKAELTKSFALTWAAASIRMLESDFLKLENKKDLTE